MIRRILFILALWLPLSAQAAIDAFEFRDDTTRERFAHLTAELRCPKCQNQNIADSNSPIASDLRHEIHRMLQDGASDEEIVDFMVARYGEFVLYRPRLDNQTLLLWYGPFGLLLIGAVVVLVLTRKRRRAVDDPTHPEHHLSEAEQRRLDQLLKQDEK